LAKDLDPALSENTRAKTLILLRDIICESGGDGTIKLQYSKAMKELHSGDSLEKIRRTVLSDGGEIWGQIISTLDSQIDPSQLKELYLSLIKILSHE